jgi:hypothetical protein
MTTQMLPTSKRLCLLWGLYLKVRYLIRLVVSCYVLLAAVTAQGKQLEHRTYKLQNREYSTTAQHLRAIQSLAPGEWLKLPKPLADSRCGDAHGRAWGVKMPYSARRQGAFLFGEGRHGATTLRQESRYYDDDLYFYDIRMNQWHCLYPGYLLGAYPLGLNEDGFETLNGNPLPVASMVHAYGMVSYDSQRDFFIHLWSPSGYWRKHMPERLAFIHKNKAILNGLGRGWSDHANASPWAFDPIAGHWRRHTTTGLQPRLTHGSHLEYLPGVDQYFIYTRSGAYAYDPEKMHWSVLSPDGPPPPTPIDAATCYDYRRDRIYFAMGAYGDRGLVDGTDNRLWAYDARDNRWLDLHPRKGLAPPRGSKGQGMNFTLIHCNNLQDSVLAISRLADNAIYIYSPAHNRWWPVALGKTPADWSARARHGFYSPEFDRHFFFLAGDSRTDGDMYVYRMPELAWEELENDSPADVSGR